MIACFSFVFTSRSTPFTISVPSSSATCRFLISSSATCQNVLCLDDEPESERGPTGPVRPMVAGPGSRYAGPMPNVGPWEIILLLLLALLLFGAKRLPEIGRSVGRGMREFKDSVAGKDVDDEPAELPRQTTSDTTVPARERDPV